jgi:hypothetical protein
MPVCGENPLKKYHISSEGEVSPCVYHSSGAITLKGYTGNKLETEKVSFEIASEDPSTNMATINMLNSESALKKRRRAITDYLRLIEKGLR